MGVRVLVAQASANRSEVVVGLRPADAGLEARDDSQKSLCPIAAPRVGCRRVGHDDVRIANESHEIRPQHADDREGFAIQHDRLADRIDGAAEAPLPHAMTDERRWTLLVLRLKRPTELDLRPGDLEVVGGHPHRGEPFGVATTGQVRAPPEHRHDAVQRPVGLLKSCTSSSESGCRSVPGRTIVNVIRRSGSESGSGRIRMARTSANIAVFAPIASASTVTTLTAKDGLPPEAANGLPEIAERHVRRLRPSRATMKLIVFMKTMNLYRG